MQSIKPLRRPVNDQGGHTSEELRRKGEASACESEGLQLERDHAGRGGEGEPTRRESGKESLNFLPFARSFDISVNPCYRRVIKPAAPLPACVIRRVFFALLRALRTFFISEKGTMFLEGSLNLPSRMLPLVKGLPAFLSP